MGKRKTPAALIKAIEQHWGMMEHVEEAIRVKTTVPVENQAEHIKAKSVDYWIGLAHGYSAQLENMLHNAGCYAGFQHMSQNKIFKGEFQDIIHRIAVGPDHPEYTSWRVQYFARS